MEPQTQRSTSPGRPDPSSSVSPNRVEPPEPRGFTLDRVVRLILWGLGLAFMGWVVWYFMGLFVYLAIGGILAYFMTPTVYWFRGIGMSQMTSIVTTFLLVFGGLFFFIYTFAPYLFSQLIGLTDQLSLDALTSVVRNVEEQLVMHLPFIQEGALIQSLETVADTLFQQERLGGTVGSVVALFTHIFYAGIAIPFITFFFLKDGTHLRRQALQMVPNRYFEITLAILSKVERSIGRYFKALLVQCTAVAVVASILLSMIGLNYAIVVGIFVGLANSIPYFGPLVGFIAGSLVGIVQTGDFTMVPWVLLAMAATQASDNVFFQPLIFSKAAQAHPLIILFVVLIGAQLGGIVGMLIAIPVATVLRVLVSEILWSVRNYRVLSSRR